MSMRLRHNFPIIKTKRYDAFMHNINTALLFHSNDKARFRLHLVTLLDKHGWSVVHQAFPGVSRASVYRWRKQYLDSGKKLTSLIPKSTKPHKVKEMLVPADILGFIKHLRQTHPYLSKYKIKPLLDEYCREKGLKTRSVSWIGKLLSRYQLFFGTRKPTRRKRRKLRYGKRVYRSPNVSKLGLGYLQLDGVIIYYQGTRYCFLSALELKTRQAWAKRVPTISSYHAKQFLLKIINQINYPIHTVHTDNGSEFSGLFEQTIKQLKLTKLFSPPKTPKVNSFIERFNRTLQEEFVNYELDTALVSTSLFDKKLNRWLYWYNYKRPHHGLNLKTPQQQLMLELAKLKHKNQSVKSAK